MTALAEKLKPQLTTLSSADRAELASYLLESLDGPTDANADQAWATELLQRAGEVRTGRALVCLATHSAQSIVATRTSRTASSGR